jgi:small subunit ribosomal protein S3Ae
MAQKSKTTAKSMDKWKKKKWYTVLAPSSFDKQKLGETPAAKPNLVQDRTITVNLDKLTGDRKQRHVSITFKVNQVQGLNAQTETVGHQIKPGYLSRLVRRRRSKINSINLVKCRDGKQIRVNALCLCSMKVPNKVETSLRKMMDDEILKTAKRKDSEQFIQELIFGSLAAKLFKQAKNYAIIKRIEIIKSRIVEDRRTKETTRAVEEAPTVKPTEAATENVVPNAGTATN